MSLGEVDTLNLLSEKLDNLFNDSQGYYETFLDTNNLFKNGKIGEKEFFQKLGDYVVAYSALEFLAVKVILELKKSIDKIAGGKAPGGTQSPGLMPGIGSTFLGLLQATSLYDENKNLLGSNTVIFDLTQMNDEKIKEYEEFFKESRNRLNEIKEKDYDQLDENSKSEYEGLAEMFDMLSAVDLKKMQ